LIDKGFSDCVAAAFADAAKLTRRAKHWHDVMVAETGREAQALAESPPIFSG
jgi:hypothetical protein